MNDKLSTAGILDNTVEVIISTFSKKHMSCKSTWNRLGLAVVDVKSKNRILQKENLVKNDKNRVAKKR